jgi:hypothetical protein
MTSSSGDPYSRKKHEAELRDDLSSCLTSYYKLSAFGILVGLPLSMKTKSYWPFVVGGLIGTGLDFRQAKIDCEPKQAALDAFLKENKKT